MKTQRGDAPFVLGGIAIEKGSETAVEIELPKLYHLPTTLPVWVIRGKRDGPVVFVSAAIHGDELVGIEIIRRLRKLPVIRRIKGTLILVPIVNVYGIMTLSRYLPDRRDLNRSFPGSTKGSLASRVAKTFFDEIVMKCDLGIDLHTGAIHRSNLPQIRTNIDNETTLNLARAFAAPVILHSELRDNSLRQTAQDRGIPILLYEAGEALRFDEASVRIGVKGIVNVLRAFGMLGAVKRKHPAAPVVAHESSWLRAPESGILRSVKGLGATVSTGEVIAYIDDPIVDESDEIRAAFDGVIIGRSVIPLVQEGDAIFHIAKFEDLDTAEATVNSLHDEPRPADEGGPYEEPPLI